MARLTALAGRPFSRAEVAKTFGLRKAYALQWLQMCQREGYVKRLRPGHYEVVS